MNNIHKLYMPHLKMAELISLDYELLSILERLDIKLGFGDASISEVCERYHLSTAMFLMICNIYSFEAYFPDVNALKTTDIPHIINFLRVSHHYYINELLPRLHMNIHTMLEDCDELNHRVLNRFYDDYDSEVLHHFDYEEKIVFPYIEHLLDNNHFKDDHYNIKTFDKNHSNIDEKLNDLKKIVIKYIPEENSNKARFEVVNSIFQVERDLIKHTAIENKLLIPLVSKLEGNE